MTTNKGFIYGLRDPRDKELHYVGRTINSLERRLNEHVTRSLRGSNSKKSVWIRELDVLGLRPEIFLIEEVSIDSIVLAEGSWIDAYINYGAVLYNETSHNVGGKSVDRIQWTDEMIAMLGNVSDTAISIQFSIDRKSVEYKRTSLGIARLPQQNFSGPKGQIPHNYIELPQHIIDRLGTQSDVSLAREIGVEKSMIRRRRIKLGIADWSSINNDPTKYSKGHIPTRWMKGGI